MLTPTPEKKKRTRNTSELTLSGAVAAIQKIDADMRDEYAKVQERRQARVAAVLRRVPPEMHELVQEKLHDEEYFETCEAEAGEVVAQDPRGYVPDDAEPPIPESLRRAPEPAAPVIERDRESGKSRRVGT